QKERERDPASQDSSFSRLSGFGIGLHIHAPWQACGRVKNCRSLCGTRRFYQLQFIAPVNSGVKSLLKYLASRDPETTSGSSVPSRSFPVSLCDRGSPTPHPNLQTAH